MRIAVFSAKPYDRTFITRANKEERLTVDTAPLANSFDAVAPS